MADLTPDDLQKLTDEREARVRPVVKQLMQAMLDQNVLLADRTYIDALIKQELEVVFKAIVFQHYNTILELLENDLRYALQLTQHAALGKDPEALNMQDLDAGVKKYVEAQQREKNSK